MMDIIQKSSGRWVIIHALREIAKDFDSEAAAWAWADEQIDDQIFCTPNKLSTVLEYRNPAIVEDDGSYERVPFGWKPPIPGLS
jgi:hypothetical protein